MFMSGFKSISCNLVVGANPCVPVSSPVSTETSLLEDAKRL